MISPATLSVPEAGRVLSLGRNASYAAAKRGELPVLKIGGKLRVPTHLLAEMLNAPTIDDRDSGGWPTGFVKGPASP